MAIYPYGCERIKPYYHDGQLNMTFLALCLSHFVNGVSHRHSEVSTDLFSNYEIDSITNGVHPQTWVGDAFQEIFDEWLPRWCCDPFVFRNIFRVPEDRLLEAHAAQKAELFNHVAEATGVELNTDVLAIGFARRMTAIQRSGQKSCGTASGSTDRFSTATACCSSMSSIPIV